jgi:putative tricarboxylic transport membrane protein
MVFLQKPISAVMLILAAILLTITLLPAVAKKREEVFVEDEK